MRLFDKIVVISLIVFSIISSYFVFRFGISAELWIVSVVFMMLFAAPSFISLYIADKKKAVITLVALGIFSLGIESFAIKTGFPYGSFYYGGGLGPKVFGLAPIMVPFAWVPLVIGTYSIASRFMTDWRIIPTVAILLVIVDIVLDPGAYALNVWVWTPPGVFYGVPLQNYFGWFLSGLIGSAMMLRLFGKSMKAVVSSTAELSLILTLTFWTGIAFWFQLWIPLIVGIALLACYFLFVTARNQQ